MEKNSLLKKHNMRLITYHSNSFNKSMNEAQISASFFENTQLFHNKYV